MKKYLLSILLMTTMIAVQGQDSIRGLIFSAMLDTTQQDSLTVESSARGVAGFLYDDDSLLFDVTVNGLTGPIMEAGIHSGMDSVLVSLDDYIDRNSIRGLMSNVMFGDTLMQHMVKGDAFVVIHTQANPGGEIRGRIMLESDINFGAALDTEQAGIMDTLDMMPIGLSSFNLNLDSTMLEVSVIAVDLTSPITNAHLHYGAPGVSGPAVVPLMPYRQGNTFMGMVDLNALEDRDAFIDSLNMGLVYVNVHTENYPAGEIRGQLGRHNGLAFDSWMDEEQETGPIDPGTPESAKGLMHMFVNDTYDSLEIHYVVDSLSGPIMASHFHLGAMGVPGPVLVPLTDSVVGSMVMLSLAADSPQFSDEVDFNEFLLETLKGNVFINVHTELNPAGEIRGQVMAITRHGVVFNLCSKQEPGTIVGDATGQGSGFVTLDRMDNSLHYGIAVSDLTGPLTGAHFHLGLPGVSGPVIHPLPMDSVVSGFWSDTTFTAERVEQFYNGEIYANFHTTANPAGELRGQLTLNNLCSVPLGVDGYIADDNALILYPNPVRSDATLTYSLAQKGEVVIRIFDLAGKEAGHLSAGVQAAGDYQQKLDISQLQNGMYIISLIIEGNPAAKVKMLVNR